MRENNTQEMISVSDILSSKESITDFSEILDCYTSNYLLKDNYYQVGKITAVQGWVFHVSVIQVHLIQLIQKLLPHLLYECIPFKIISTAQEYSHLMAGLNGYEKVGKVLCIYPTEQLDLLSLAKTLIRITNGFKGPAVPTDIYLGGAIHTSYGGHAPNVIVGVNGKPENYIHNALGTLVKEEITVPFKLPKGIIWPFFEITSPEPPKNKVLLNKAYIAYDLLKSNSKGDAVKGISIKKILNIHLCFIKQGKKCAFADEVGRDIRDRLSWQQQITSDLQSHVKMPKLLDFFYDQDDAYLVTEYIDGITLDKYNYQLFKNNNWINLPKEEKFTSLDYLLQVLQAVKIFHEFGYIHRDINPTNFLVDKNNILYVIDPELAYSTRRYMPNPPFKLGTPGYMSPEQLNEQSPTINEDIYAIGATMILLFTGIHPIKLKPESNAVLESNLQYFIDDISLVQLITQCIEIESSHRPGIDTIITEVRHYRDRLNILQNKVQKSVSPAITSTFIEKALNGLSHNSFLTRDGIWNTISGDPSPLIDNENKQAFVYPGLWEGLSGPLYLIATAKNFYFNVEACIETYNINLSYLNHNYLSNLSGLADGLSGGKAGIAIALSRGIKSGLISDKSEFLPVIQECLTSDVIALDLAYGWSGIGLSLIKCSDVLESSFVKSRLGSIVSIILSKQSKDGSWNTTGFRGNTHIEKFTGMAIGIAGIVHFLLYYYESYPDQSVEQCIVKALHWLTKHTIKDKRNSIAWQYSTKNKKGDPYYANGSAGIISTYIKAYKVLNNTRYKEIAQKALGFYSPFCMDSRFTLGGGIAGIGRLYLNAFNTFHQEEYLYQANWIASILSRFYIHDNEAVYWLSNNATSPTAGLYNGCSGIIDFLIRVHKQDKCL